MIDLRDRKWDKKLGQPNTGHAAAIKLKKTLNAKKRDFTCLCDEKKRKSCWVHLGKRIGSESNAGQVFEVTFRLGSETAPTDMVTAVAKVMPQDKAGNWKREVDIATYLSSLVEKKETTFFPIVFAVLIDQKVLLPTLKNPIQQYRTVTEFENENPSYENVRTKSKTLMPSPQLDCQRSVIMFSERSWGDLKQFAEYLRTQSNFTEQEQILIWLDIVHQVEEAVCFMQSHGILHNDLHTGNVLVDPYKDKEGRIGFRIKLHDFGMSRAIDKEDPDHLDDTWDLQQFLGELAELSTPLSMWLACLQGEVGKWHPTEGEPCFIKDYSVADVNKLLAEKRKQQRGRRGRGRSPPPRGDWED